MSTPEESARPARAHASAHPASRQVVLTRHGWRRLVFLSVGVVVLATVLAMILGMPSIDLATALGEPTSWERGAWLQLQLPRLLLGLAAGAVLAVSGTVLQGLLRNPLADPFILGVSGGAALGSALAGLSMSALGASVAGAVRLVEPLGGFLGALGALALVLALSSERGQRRAPQPLRMLLVGVVVNALAGAALMVLAAVADPAAMQRTLVRLMGSFGVDPTRLWIVGAAVAAAILVIAIALPAARSLDALALGDETAESVGVAPERLRRRLLVWMSLPVGDIVAATGLVGVVGLVVPHAVRLVVGPAHVRLLPLVAAFGAAFVVLADATASAFAPLLGGHELPAGVVTALVGGPVFLFLLRARPRGEG